MKVFSMTRVYLQVRILRYGHLLGIVLAHLSVKVL